MLEDLLRACVVRVEGGPKPGAGFFVAPGQVLTCVHVIGHESAPLSVRLRDGHVVTASGTPVLFCDRGRPIPELDDDYPDLALLDVAVDGHPCVAIDQDWPRLGDELQAYGYPMEGGSVLLTPLGLSYTGKKGSDASPYIDLSSRTPVTGGMSGGPLFSVRSGAICAILVATRSPEHAHGGLAVSWLALPPDALAELVERNDRFQQQDRRWDRARAGARRHVRFGHVHVTEHFAGRTAELATRLAETTPGSRPLRRVASRRPWPQPLPRRHTRRCLRRCGR